MKDLQGRSIDYLRISLTDRCNLRCIYCMPEEGVVPLCHNDILRVEELTTITKAASELGIKHVRLTGGEPLVRRGVVNLIRDIKAIPEIESVALTTNATLLPEFATDLKEAGLDRVNISLDTLDAEQYAYITRRGKLEDAIAGIHAAIEHNLTPVKLNVVVVKDLNQDLLEFAKLTINKPLHVRFIEYMPVGDANNFTGCKWGPEEIIPSKEVIETINASALESGMKPLVSLDNNNQPEGWGPARYFKFEGALGTVGTISAISNHFCATCNRLRLTSDGKIKPCLFSDAEYDLKTPLRAGDIDGMKTVLRDALLHKPESHNHRIGTKRKMSQIGG